MLKKTGFVFLSVVSMLLALTACSSAPAKEPERKDKSFLP